jgi:voltage-gated sodium channel
MASNGQAARARQAQSPRVRRFPEQERRLLNEELTLERDNGQCSPRSRNQRTLSVTLDQERESGQKKDRTTALLDTHFPKRESYEQRPMSEKFNTFMACIIISSCAQMGAACQWPRLQVYFFLDIFFVSVYSFECVARLKVKGGIRELIRDEQTGVWNTFDLILTFAMLVDILVTVIHSPGETGEDDAFFKLIRLLRVLRVIRILRILHLVEQLTVVVQGLTESVTTIGWIILLLMLLIYFFAIFFVQEVNHELFDPDKDPFLDLVTAMLTLTNVVVFAAWTETIPPQQPALLVVFFMFVLLASFGVLNVIIGVIVDATSETKKLIQWDKNRLNLARAGKVWEQKIHAAGLSQQALSALGPAEKEEKMKERKGAVLGILGEIIAMGMVPFPAGTKADDVARLIDNDGDGDISHEAFVLCLGRIVLGDAVHTTLMTLTNQGIISNNIHDLSMRMEKLESGQAEILKYLDQMMRPNPEESGGFLPRMGRRRANNKH